MDPVAGYVLCEWLHCDGSLGLDGVKHWLDFVFRQEGQRKHLPYEGEGLLIMVVSTL